MYHHSHHSHSLPTPPPPPLSQEQKWTDEVHYLHSLWYQGPNPPSSTNPKPKPTITAHLSPSNPTSFKKNKTNKNKKKKTMTSPSPEPVTTPETQERMLAIQLHQKSLKAAQDFFSGGGGGDDDDSLDDEENEYQFFKGVFKEDNELRLYYEKNYESGVFCCLVCGGIGEKVGKRFKDCAGLVNHSMAVSKKRSGHRAFGQMVCKILGWDVQMFPRIDPLKSSLVNVDCVNEWSPESVRKPVIGWGDPVSKPEPTFTPEALERFAAIQLQKKSLKATQEFFSRNVEDSDDEDNEDESLNDEEEEGDSEESEEFEFFVGVFKEDNELRSYYEKNYESGVFCCLVCGAVGEKVGKRFKDCVALVQHSVAVSKTKRMRAHRAFGKVVCRVIGWNINRLPSIVLSLDEPLGRVLVNADSPENNGIVEESVLKADNVGDEQNETIHNEVDVSLELDERDRTECEVGLNIDEDSHQNGLHEKEIFDSLGINSEVGLNEVDAYELYKDLDQDILGPIGSIDEKYMN